MEIRPGRIHTHTHIHTRVSGNEIKKIANNSNRNCPGHIPSFPLIRSLYGAEGERGGRKEERNHSTTFRIDASSRSGLSDRFSFRGLVSGCYLQPPPLLYTVLRKRPTLRKNSFGSNKQSFLPSANRKEEEHPWNIFRASLLLNNNAKFLGGRGEIGTRFSDPFCERIEQWKAKHSHLV